MISPRRDFKRRAKRAKLSIGGCEADRQRKWLSISLGVGDPLPSVVERMIKRSGAKIISRSSWGMAGYYSRSVRFPWGGSYSHSTFEEKRPRGGHHSHGARRWRSVHRMHHYIWKFHATPEQQAAITRKLFEMGLI